MAAHESASYPPTEGRRYPPLSREVRFFLDEETSLPTAFAVGTELAVEIGHLARDRRLEPIRRERRAQITREGVSPNSPLTK